MDNYGNQKKFRTFLFSIPKNLHIQDIAYLNRFPNKTEDDRILTLLLGKKNSYEYAEERRLFYVALTRTKSIVYLLANKNNTSEFIKLILQLSVLLY